MTQPPSDPSRLADSTIKLETPPPGDVRCLEPLIGVHGLQLMTFHGSHGRPLRRREGPRPPAELCWNARYKIGRLLGRGSQGAVYLARREGADGYFTNVALKLFYRADDITPEEYAAEMRRIARQSQRVSVIQHDNLVYIRDFVALEGDATRDDTTRVMILEWVDGLDLARLLEPGRLESLRERLSPSEWKRLDDVIVGPGEDHCRLKPGIAVDIIRGCLAGLSSLHHVGIVHCDLKPSNIMIKRTGTKKLIDLDSSCIPSQEPGVYRGTPYYMAPEQLRGSSLDEASDIASLGYILIELLTGRLLFRDCETIQDLVEAKTELPRKLDLLLPPEVRRSAILRALVAKMVAVEPRDRFPDADAAELDRVGAVSFHRQLVQTNLSTEYGRELAWWIERIHEKLDDGASHA
ncbi:MAG: serine/threonine protein kinase [Planctomycetes bacterium]|nr:serine/threonine protein kinase [Planctomycetota bacterium]